MQGFRKIGLINDWEYENPNFQAGKQYLLANITRRNKRTRQSYQSRTLSNNLLEAKVEVLRSQIKESELQIEELKRRQQEIELKLIQLQNVHVKSEKILYLLGRECGQLVIVESNEDANELEFMEGNIDGGQEKVSEDELNKISGNQSITVLSNESGN